MSSMRNEVIPRKLILVLCLPFLTLGCASYQIGNQVLFRCDVRTVHVPIFESDSFRKYLGERLTEAVVKEIESRSPYKIVALANADSILKGKIVSEEKRVIIESRNDDARQLQTTLVVTANWTDRYGRPLMNTPSIDVSELSNFVPEGGQSLATAYRDMIDKVARDIVSQMELPW
jgi:hypothetical protein